MSPRESENTFEPPKWVQDEDKRPSGGVVISRNQKIVFGSVFLIAIPFCLWAGWFEFGRAQHGNWRAWVYTFEWPFFGGVAIYLWRRLLRGDIPSIPRPDFEKLAKLADEDEGKSSPSD